MGAGRVTLLVARQTVHGARALARVARRLASALAATATAIKARLKRRTRAGAKPSSIPGTPGAPADDTTRLLALAIIALAGVVAAAQGTAARTAPHCTPADARPPARAPALRLLLPVATGAKRQRRGKRASA